MTLVGEFLRPGIYDIRRGERLSEVIARAGGLTPRPTLMAPSSAATVCGSASRRASSAPRGNWSRG
ncbi:SLBB domain-containing protein [Siccirubricoccus deserti]